LANATTNTLEEQFIYMFGGILTLTESTTETINIGTGFQY